VKRDKPQKTLRIVALLDGRPGHEKQTMGIIHALQQICLVEIVPIKVGHFSLLGEILQTCRLFLPGSTGSDPDRRVDRADLLIGTGSRTHLPMLLYKKKYAIPAVTCMMPPRYLQHRFDLCFVPEHDGMPEQGNIMLTIGAPNRSINKRTHQVGCGLILLGGVDPKSHRWDSRQIVAMVEKIVSTDTGKHWTISSSPRTPQDTVVLLNELLQKYDNIQFFDYRETPAGWIEKQYDLNSAVWVTADSISMIYEAISAGCRVGLIPMQWLHKTGKFSRNEHLLIDKKLVTPFTAWQQGGMNRGDIKELNEAQRCAERIVQKWWPENLP
jgi:mitochondrial fission protein ELM1